MKSSADVGWFVFLCLKKMLSINFKAISVTLIDNVLLLK